MIDFFDLHPFYEGSETLATITKGSTLQQIRMKKKILLLTVGAKFFFFFISLIFLTRQMLYKEANIFL